MNKFIDFVPKRPAPAVEKHPVADKPVAERRIKKPTEKMPEKKPVDAEPTLRKAIPRKRNLRMDFARRPKNAPLPKVPEVKVKKTVQISVATAPKMKPAPVKKVVRSVNVIWPAEPKPKLKEPEEPEELNEPEELEELDDIEPLMDDDDLSLALAGFADAEEAPVLTDKRSKEVSDFEDELDALDELDAVSDDLEAEIADFVEEPKPIFEKKKPSVPDANRFSLGGRSPFLTSVKVEKRPLSGVVPESVKTIKSETKTPIKNSYRAKIKKVLKDDGKAVRHETTIISTPANHSNNIGLAIAILLTIILGALIGAVIYLVFFQH